MPTREEAFDLMARHGMPRHIQRHSVQVARVAVGLARGLRAVGLALDLPLVESGALLHDIGKAEAIASGGDHAEIGARLVVEAGYAAVEDIIRQHVVLDDSVARPPLDESTIVNYSDKRVRHDRVVTLEERFADLVARYARSEENARRLGALLDVYRDFELVLFRTLGAESADLEPWLARDVQEPARLNGP